MEKKRKNTIYIKSGVFISQWVKVLQIIIDNDDLINIYLLDNTRKITSRYVTKVKHHEYKLLSCVLSVIKLDINHSIR